MKNGKRPTRAQKKLMSQYKLNYENWLVIKDTPEQMTVVHRYSNQTRVIPKEDKRYGNLS